MNGAKVICEKKDFERPFKRVIQIGGLPAFDERATEEDVCRSRSRSSSANDPTRMIYEFIAEKLSTPQKRIRYNTREIGTYRTRENSSRLGTTSTTGSFTQRNILYNAYYKVPPRANISFYFPLVKKKSKAKRNQEKKIKREKLRTFHEP